MPADNPPEEPDVPGPPTEAGSGPEAAQPAQEVINRFGGIRPMASKLGVAVSTVQGWRTRASIPANRHAQILEAARAHGIDIDPEALAASDRAQEERPAEARTAADAAYGLAAPQPRTNRAEAAAASRSQAAGGWWRPFALGALVVLVAVGATVLARDLWLPLIGPAGDQAERDPAAENWTAELEVARRERAVLEQSVNELRQDIAALSDQLGPLRQGLAGGEDARAALEGLRQRVDALSGLDGRMSALAARVDELSQGVDRLAERSADSRAEIAGEAALALAALQLRDALHAVGPFAAELDIIEDLARTEAVPDGAALAELVQPLRPYAERGVPSLDALKARFAEVANDVVAASRGGEEEGWIGGVARRLSNVVSVRPVGPVEGSGPAAVVARAEAHLASDDLAAALQELEALQGPAADAAADWRGQAQARLTAQRVLTELGQRLVSRLEPAGG